MKMRFWLLLIGLSVGGFTLRAEDAQIFIDVGKAQVKKSLLAMPPVLYSGTQPSNSAHIQAGHSLFSVIVNDLTVSNFFTFIKPDAYLEDPAKTGLLPAPGAPNGFSFEKWKTIGTEFLIRSSFNVLNNELKFQVYVYHVPTAKVVMAKNYSGALAAHRRMAHTFANDLVKALTGKRGMFLSKIVASRQEPGNTAKEIYTMDWDGTNFFPVTSDKTISISPAWSNKGDKIAYTTFQFHKANKVRNSDLFVYEPGTGKRYMVSYRKGINSGAAFMPNDLFMLLTLSYQGNPDIYKMSADGATLEALTNGPNRAANVEPAISPDGKTLAFASDRSGRPMIYLMNMDKTGLKRLTMAGKFNASPAWSPDGKTLAFAGQDQNHFDIFTINIDGTNLKRLTDAKKPNGKAAHNESPSWSPDGRHILFTSDRTGKYQLYIVSPDGTNERRITDDKFSWDKPKWSPFLD